MRIPCTWIVLIMLGGCSATQVQDSDFVEIDAAVAAGCLEPSALIRELRNAHSKNISTASTPIRVPAGVYSIGVSCGSIFDGAVQACLDTSATPSPSDIPTYELLLQSGKRYVFSCSIVENQYVVRLSEDTL